MWTKEALDPVDRSLLCGSDSIFYRYAAQLLAWEQWPPLKPCTNGCRFDESLLVLFTFLWRLVCRYGHCIFVIDIWMDGDSWNWIVVDALDWPNKRLILSFLVLAGTVSNLLILDFHTLYHVPDNFLNEAVIREIDANLIRNQTLPVSK